MLDHEPDTDQTTPPSTDTTTVPPVRPRRRAASRPAGPPIASPLSADPPAAPPTSGPPVDPGPAGLIPAFSSEPDPVSDPDRDPAPARKTAKRPAARRTAKKVAAPEPDETAAAPPARTPRKRATRKATAVPAAETSAADVVAETSTAPASGADPVSVPVEAGPEPTAPAEPAQEQEQVDLEHDPQVVIAPVDETAAAGPQPEEPEPVDATPNGPGEVEPVPVETDRATEDDAAKDETDEDADESADGDEGGRRRRRRRGGRRRRRGSGGDTSSDAEGDEPDADASGPSDETSETAAEPPAPADGDHAGTPEDPQQAAEAAEEGDSQRRRRRRRRRRGEDSGDAPADGTEIVDRVREPRRGKNGRGGAKDNDEVTGISGSTRMEAKRQRRREGREAGRRRAPILSEAEFLARRESVSRQMIVRQRDDLSQIAVLEDGVLVEHYVDRESAASLIGNVYLGRVQNVLPSMEAAFIDIGRGRNAVLYAGEVDWDSFGAQGQNRKVEKVLKSGQSVLVQVTRDPVGAKGARLTHHVSIPGRYIVYAPSGHLSGISRKLSDKERRRLKAVLSELIGEASVIVRTAAEGASEDELVRDVNRLKAQWADIEKKVAAGKAPQLLYGEPDLTVRIVRDLFTEDFSELVVAGNGTANDAYEAVEAYVGHVAPHLADRLRRYVTAPAAGEGAGEGDGAAVDPGAAEDVFTRYRIDEQIAKALERKVFLPSGGSLVIDRTEAMTVIDVNTGKFTGSGGNLEATVTSNNLEAAEEIVRQLRLRDIGGIIVIDFIDMVLPNNRELLLRRLVECLGRDRTRHQVAEVTSLGLVQMTRKKIGTGLLEAFGTECPLCHGRGLELHDLPVASQRPADGGSRDDRSRDHRRGGSSGNGHAQETKKIAAAASGA